MATPSVYLDPERKISSLDLPHRKIKQGERTYYVATFPEGDAAIHYHTLRDQHGYGESLGGFLMEDGTIEVVKGPYTCFGAFDFGEAKALGVSTVKVSKLTVGKNLSVYCGKPKSVVFQETEWHVGDWRDRVKPEWKGLEVAIERRGCIQYDKV